MMANGNGNGRLSEAWQGFDAATIQRLTVNELDRLHRKIDSLRLEMLAAFEEQEKRSNRNTAFLLTAIGGILVGLVLLVFQLSSGA